MVISLHNLLSPSCWETARQAWPHRGLHSVGIHTRGRGLMNPATKKYPRPNLPLLCKWFKQRNERHIIKRRVSAKSFEPRPPSTSVVKRGGGYSNLDIVGLLGIHYRPR